MLVKELLQGKSKDIISITASTPIHRAMELLLHHHISCLPVLNDTKELVGIITDKDIFRLLFEHAGIAPTLAMTVGEVMTKNLIVGLLTDDLSYIASIMTNNRIRHVPIIEEKQIIGLLSVGDIVKTQMADIEIDNRYLKKYIEGAYPG